MREFTVTVELIDSGDQVPDIAVGFAVSSWFYRIADVAAAYALSVSNVYFLHVENVICEHTSQTIRQLRR